MTRAILTVMTIIGVAFFLARTPPSDSILAAPTPVRQAAALKLPAELPSASGYGSVDALPGMKFKNPICIDTPPGETDRLFVVERAGKIQVIIGYGAKPQKSEFLDIAAVVGARGDTFLVDGEMGAWGLAFHPQYAKNGYFYVTYGFSTAGDGKPQMFNRLSRFSVSKSDPNAADPQSEQPILSQLDRATNHNGGDIHFGHDGYLYWSNGDEGGGGDNMGNSRLIDKNLFAGIFRLDVDKRQGNLKPNPHTQASKAYPSAVHADTYLVPADNPFIGRKSHDGKSVDPKKVRTELWCTGLRNPWRFSFDPHDGQMFIGNVGDLEWEQIYLGAPGADYGWNFYEGGHDGPGKRKMPAGAKFTMPIVDYAHKPGGPNGMQGGSVTGGIVYRGTQMSELFGTYIFSDYGSRRIWGAKRVGNDWQVRTLVERDDDFVSFAPDPRNGDVLMVSLGGDRIKRLVRKGVTGNPPPKLLSETGTFSDLKALTPAPGLVPFEPNAPFWSDHAIKTRWFSVPAGQSITFDRDGNWTFPAGTVWVKHFDIELTRGDVKSKRRLETRFLVKTADGVYGITYKWREDESDAELVAESGSDEQLPIRVNGQARQQTWRYPARNECNTCHTAVGGYALGFNTVQLNRAGKTGNQIQAMSDAGYFTKPVGSLTGLPALVNPADASKPIEARARSYLTANCVHCHQPGGGATGLWDARFTTPLGKTNIVNSPVQNTLGDPKNRFIAPSDPAHSVLLKRLTGEAPRMPPLATNELDQAHIELMTEWIKKLPR